MVVDKTLARKVKLLQEITEHEEKIHDLLLEVTGITSKPPLFDLLDSLIDDLIQCSIMLRDDSLSPSHNPSLIFAEKDFGLMKGFPVSFKIRDSRRIIIDKPLSLLLKEVSKILVYFKRSSNLHFHDEDLIEEIKRHRNKMQQRYSWSRYTCNKFYSLLQEEFSSYQNQNVILRFLQWINSGNFERGSYKE